MSFITRTSTAPKTLVSRHSTSQIIKTANLNSQQTKSTTKLQKYVSDSISSSSTDRLEKSKAVAENYIKTTDRNVEHKMLRSGQRVDDRGEGGLSQNQQYLLEMIGSLQATILDYTQKLEQIKKVNTRLLEQKQAKIDQLTAKFLKYSFSRESEIHSLRKQLKRQQRELNDIVQQHVKAAERATQSKIIPKLYSKINALAGLKSKNAALLQTISYDQGLIERLESKLMTLNHQLSKDKQQAIIELVGKITNLEEHNNELTQQKQEMLLNFQNLQQQVAHIRESTQTTEREIAMLKQNLQKQTSRANLLEQIRNEHLALIQDLEAEVIQKRAQMAKIKLEINGTLQVGADTLPRPKQINAPETVLEKRNIINASHSVYTAMSTATPHHKPIRPNK